MSRVTILVPNYNREALLRTCLESITAQTFDDWRAVIGDNASTDRSADVVRSFRDPRFELVCRPQNVGYIRNTNLLLEDIDSEFVAILHSDDWWEPAFLQQLVGLLDRSPEALMAVSAVNYRADGRPVLVKTLTGGGSTRTEVLSPAHAAKALVHRWPYLTPSDVVCRTELYRRWGGFDESLPLSTDWLMWLRAASSGPVAVCDLPLANNLIHVSSITGEGEREARWADEWIRLERIVAVDWGDAEPYPDAAADLRATNALRFVMKSYELHEAGSRTISLKLARLAQSTAPSPSLRAAALLLQIFIRVTPGRAAVRLRRLASRLVRGLPRRRTPVSMAWIGMSELKDILATLERVD